MKINLNIIIIVFLCLIPISFGIKKLVEYVITLKKRDKVRKLLDKEVNKKIIYSPSQILKTLNQLMTPKYFSNIFYKQYLPISRYNMNETLSLKKYLKLESSPMESNYYFNLCKNNMANILNIEIIFAQTIGYNGTFCFAVAFLIFASCCAVIQKKCSQ